MVKTKKSAAGAMLIPNAPEVRNALLRDSGSDPRRYEEYFLEAIATVRANRRNYTRRRPAQFMEAREYGFVVE